MSTEEEPVKIKKSDLLEMLEEVRELRKMIEGGTSQASVQEQ